MSARARSLSRFREDAIPLVDGDVTGDAYVAQLVAPKPRPRIIVRYGKAACVECLAAWILEPTLADPGPILAGLFANPADRNLKRLQHVLFDRKKDQELHELLAWEALATPAAVMRAGEFLQDLASMASGRTPGNPGWTSEVQPNGVTIQQATHIAKVK